MTDLDARYGRTPGAHRRRRVVAIVAAAAVAVVVTAWVAWAGLLSPAATVEVSTTGYEHGHDSVIVHYRLTTDAGTASTCAVEALDEGFGVVGWRVVDVPPSAQRSRLLSTEVRISQPATTGLICRCWTA
jgi:hypothetical protein